jgi:hypothetical protein
MLVTRGLAALGYDDEPASPRWPTVGAGLEMATPESFTEPTALGWPAVPSCSEAVAPGSRNGALARDRSPGT